MPRERQAVARRHLPLAPWRRRPLRRAHRSPRVMAKTAAFSGEPRMCSLQRSTLAGLLPFLLSLRAPAADVRRATLTVREPSGVQRTGSWAENGVPFAAGELKDAAQVRLLGPDGKELPLDAVPLSLHPDGSVKWLLVSFPLDLAPRAEARCTLEYGPGVRRRPLIPRLRIDDGPDRLTIDARVLRVSWPKKVGVAGVGDVWVDLDGDGRIDADGEQVVWAADGPGISASRVHRRDDGGWQESRHIADLSAGGARLVLERAGDLALEKLPALRSLECGDQIPHKCPDVVNVPPFDEHRCEDQRGRATEEQHVFPADRLRHERPLDRLVEEPPLVVVR